MEWHFAWVRHSQDSFFRFVAGRARVQKVGIVTLARRMFFHRNRVLDVKSCATRFPELTMKTVHAPKCEFVPQPLPITAVVVISLWTVTPHMGPKKRRFSSSSSTPVE